MNKKVIVAGHICLDLTPAFSEYAVASADQFLKPGSMLQIGAADVHTGGAVANTGLAMKLLGLIDGKDWNGCIRGSCLEDSGAI